MWNVDADWDGGRGGYDGRSVRRDRDDRLRARLKLRAGPEFEVLSLAKHVIDVMERNDGVLDVIFDPNRGRMPGGDAHGEARRGRTQRKPRAVSQGNRLEIDIDVSVDVSHLRRIRAENPHGSGSARGRDGPAVDHDGIFEVDRNAIAGLGAV